MKLHSAITDGLNVITAYADDFVAVNGVRHSGSVVVRPQGAVVPWPLTDVSALNEATLAALGMTPGTVVLLGTGLRQQFPPPNVRRLLAATGCAVDIMDSGAAARTFNILVAEGRDVVAGLIVGAQS